MAFKTAVAEREDAVVLDPEQLLESDPGLPEADSVTDDASL